MGTLRVQFAETTSAAIRTKIVAQIKKLKATTKVVPLKDGDSWVFDTLGIPNKRKPVVEKKPPRVTPISDKQWAANYKAALLRSIENASPPGERLEDIEHLEKWHNAVASWNGDVWTWERCNRYADLFGDMTGAYGLAQWLEYKDTVLPLVGRVQTLLARYCAQTERKGKENSMNHEQHGDELRELAAIAQDIAAGKGGPPAYRRPGLDPRALMPTYANGNLGVGVWEGTHAPLVAMFLAGAILWGTDLERHFTRLGIHGDLVLAYAELRRVYPRSPSALPDQRPTSLAAALEAPTRVQPLLSMPRKTRPAALAAPLANTAPRLTGPARVAIPDLGGK